MEQPLTPPADQIITEVRGRMGVIALNRPRAVNALSHQMLLDIHAALDEYERDSSIVSILIAGTGERGLCAGGDVVHLYKNMHEDPEGCEEYFRQEYTLNYRLAKYPKPIISLMDGLVLGGGMGASAYGSHRIVTERSRLGMPEAVIGFSPDVGMAKMLSKAPRQLGTLMALTGMHVNAGVALVCGLADYYVPFDKIGELMGILETADDAQSIDLIIRRYVGEPPASPLAENASWVKDVFGRSSVEEIVDGVREQAATGNEFATEVLKALEHNSPTGMKVGLRAIRLAKTQELQETLEQDFYLVLNAMNRGHDMYEGIRAQVVDKDRQPKWQPDSLEGVSEELVDSFFARTEAEGLGLR